MKAGRPEEQQGSHALRLTFGTVLSNRGQSVCQRPMKCSIVGMPHISMRQLNSGIRNIVKIYRRIKQEVMDMGGKGDCHMETKINLGNQPEIVELLDVLKENGLTKECQNVELLISYLGGVEEQFGEMMEELKVMREQLTQIQDKGIKTTAMKIVDKAEGKLQEIKGQIDIVKENLTCSAKRAITAFKEKGVDALRKAVSAMKIPSALSMLKENFHSGMESMNKNAAKMAVISGELHKAKEHTKNIGRVLFGRSAKEPVLYNPDKGVTAKIKLAFLNCGEAFFHMEKATENAIQRLEQFAVKSDNKASVKMELKKIKSEKAAMPQVSVPVQDNIR